MMKINPNINQLVPYQAKQLNATIILNANESPNFLYPNGFRIDTQMNRYPNTTSDPLREALSKQWGLSVNQFIIGNGSTELLELSVKTFCEQGDTIISLNPSFAMYSIYAQMYGVSLETVELESDLNLVIDRMIQQANQFNASLIFLCTPNNPTGTLFTKDMVTRLIQNTSALVIVDEAYMEFSTKDESIINDVVSYQNALVARTFSKAYGLAQARIGYMVGNASLIQTLLKGKLPYSVNGLSMSIALDAMQKQQQVTEYINSIIQERTRLYQEYQSMGLHVFESQGNFLLIQTNKPIYETLREKGMLIRTFQNGTYRITIGTELENNAVLSAIKEIVYENE